MYGSRGAKQDGQIDKVCVCKRDSTGEGWLTGGGRGKCEEEEMEQ